MNPAKTKLRLSAAGMTIVELMVAIAIGSIVLLGSAGVFFIFLRFSNTTTLMRNTSSAASLALERMVIGVGGNAGLREATASTVTYSNTGNGWLFTYNTNLFFRYVASTQTITNDSGKVICANVTTSSVTFFTSGVATNACRVSISVGQNAGGDTWTNTFITQVQFRN